MEIISYKDNKFKEKVKKILDRSQLSYKNINESVEDILMNVKKYGDKAIKDYTKKFDDVNINNLMVDKKEIDLAYKNCDKDLIKALEKARKNIYDFHSKQLKNSWMWNKSQGITLGQVINPITPVGIYVPGGTAPYPSTLFMNAIPAKVAGVDEIIMVTPPNKYGKVNKNILAAAKIAGIDKIYKVGGAQAIGALAYGTEKIPKVNKIVGPGNIFVAIAKKCVYGHVDIDMIAGPSEILIIADENANEKFIAADLLSQAEHDTLASSILLTDSKDLAKKVKNEVKRQLNNLPRKEIAEKSLTQYGAIIVTDNIKEAIDLSNEIAPEHLELMVEKPFEIVNMVKNAGAIFLGEFSPEPLGDYIAGPNHTLPTSGTAKFFSPLGVDDFIKRSSLIYYNKNSLSKEKDQIIKIANSEGLNAHGNAIKVRFEDE
ncbi:MAG: histidinol dehydrogenase [Firmicutes bacterium]|nr:histidinol dehydrogenase [Bacillota bacterium]